MKQTFTDYFEKFQLEFEPGDLDLIFENSGFCLIHPEGKAATPGGAPFKHPSETLVRMVMATLQSTDDHLGRLSAPVLYGFAWDVVQEGEDPFLKDWDANVSGDPFVAMKITGKATVAPFGPEDPLFSFAFNTLASLTSAVNRFAALIMSETSLDEEEGHPFPAVLKLSYERLSIDQKAAVQALGVVFNASVTLPLLLVLDEISQTEFAHGLIALRRQPKEASVGILAGTASVLSFLDSTRLKQTGGKPSLRMIAEGEGDSIEFKSTLRWDIRQAKNNPAIERAVLKTIAAFINARGGTLFIGVRDDGSIEGIETDKFANDDKFLLHLWNLIRACLGTEFSPFIRSTLEKHEGLTICRVDCQPASRPAFLRQPGFPEELYVRVGPSSNALEISDALAYVEDRFNQ